MTLLDLRTAAASCALAFGIAGSLAGAAMAQEAALDGDAVETAGGEVVISPVVHASFAMQIADQIVYVDPVGAEGFEGMPAADLILITHEHGDHFDVPTLEALAGEGVVLVAPQSVTDMLPEALQGATVTLGNGETAEELGLSIEAVPAYNTTEDRLQYHPEGRDNGYVVSVDGTRVYIAGDTEDIPEMRALTDIDVAFVPMNLPFTMTVEQAADAVAEFNPTIVYPYHSRGSDIGEFERLVNENSDTEVRIGAWYPEEPEEEAAE